MTRSFAFDSRNDITLGTDGRIAIASGLEACLFACQNVAQTLQGEAQFDIELGLPNFDTIWNGQPNLPQFEASLRAALLGVSGVVSIPSLEVSLSGGVVRYSATIETQFGTGPLNVAI